MFTVYFVEVFGKEKGRRKWMEVPQTRSTELYRATAKYDELRSTRTSLVYRLVKREVLRTNGLPIEGVKDV